MSRKSLPPCPPHLSREAKAEWKRITRELDDNSLLTGADVGALGDYVEAYTECVKAERRMTALAAAYDFLLGVFKRHRNKQ
jgi:P27 family predicted phage terminase small subunit